MQSFQAGEYWDGRLQLSAFLKASGIEGWAGLWMRVDGPRGATLAFDNMEDRPLRGTTDWQKFEVVLDVPEISVKIAFGVLLSGAGRVWLDDIEFEQVSDDVDVTGAEESHLRPVNLDFEMIAREPISGR
jgi:hypothetical protein